MAKTSASAAILEAADWCKDYRRRYYNEDPTPGNNASVQARENGMAASQGSREIRQDKGDLGTENSNDDDKGSAPFRRRPRKCSADPHPRSPPKIGGSEDDWMLSNDEVPVGELRRRVGEKRQAHTRGPPKNREGSAKSSKRRKGISVGPRAVETPAQGVSRNPSTNKEGKRAEVIDKGGEGDARAAEAPFPPPPPAADTVILCKGEREATPANLFNLKRSNIRLGLTTYACSISDWSQKKSKREITKIY
jgi:hypothetical protein